MKKRIIQVITKHTITGFWPVLLGLLLILTTTQCQKEEPILNSPKQLDVKFLGHKGGGSSMFNANYIENTLPSVKDGLKWMNGAELDIQLSLDGTIWVYHNDDMGESSCNTAYHRSIPLARDSEIEKVQICQSTKKDRIYKLKEIIDYWAVTDSGFPISLHLKQEFQDTLKNAIIGGEAAYLARFVTAFQTIFPTIRHKNKLMIEVYDATFCRNMHAKVPGIKICLMKEVDFPKQINDALALGYDGLSCCIDEPTLTAAEVKRARDNGLIVQLWTPDSAADLLKAYNLKPDFVQTNNMNAINIVSGY